MFNSLPDISDDAIRHINITGNPCVGMTFTSISDIEDYVLMNGFSYENCMFIFDGEKHEMQWSEAISYLEGFWGRSPEVTFLNADTELLTDDDRKIAIRKGWYFVEE